MVNQALMAASQGAGGAAVQTHVFPKGGGRAARTVVAPVLRMVHEPVARFKIHDLCIHRVSGFQEAHNKLVLFPSTAEEMTLTTRSDEARTRAEANFKKEQRAKEGAKAMMEYQANGRLVREKTERLRALRLAKEAADRKRVG
jgi:hypothetical protein